MAPDPAPSSPAPADDGLTAALERIRERYADATAGLRPEVIKYWDCADVKPLLAAIEAVLKRHQPVKRGLSTVCSTCVHRVGNGVRYDRSSWPCPEVEAITRELTGKEPDRG